MRVLPGEELCEIQRYVCIALSRARSADPERGWLIVPRIDDPRAGLVQAGGRVICQPPSSSMRTRSSASSASLRFGSSSVRTPVPAVIVIAALA